MLWLKAFHIILMVTWFAGLFYLPRLFVYHAQAVDRIGQDRFKTMERKLLIIMSIGAVGTVITGLWLLGGWWAAALSTAGWLHIKLTCVLALIAYHLWMWLESAIRPLLSHDQRDPSAATGRHCHHGGGQAVLIAAA